jgi:hypothetical protein
MANEFTVSSFFGRWIFALLLTVGTYNPSGYSYLNWVLGEKGGVTPLIALTGIALLIAWVVFLRATLLALGWLGIVLGAALFGSLIWVFIDLGWLSLDSTGALTWVLLLLLSLILAAGMSWSHIRRRLTGQFDVDDIDD